MLRELSGAPVEQQNPLMSSGLLQLSGFPAGKLLSAPGLLLRGCQHLARADTSPFHEEETTEPTWGTYVGAPRGFCAEQAPERAPGSAQELEHSKESRIRPSAY